MNKEDGGPAFPLPPCGTGDPRDGMAGGSVGMSLRDYFAAQALSSMNDWGAIGNSFPTAADDCYAMADAMLKARSESPKTP